MTERGAICRHWKKESKVEPTFLAEPAEYCRNIRAVIVNGSHVPSITLRNSPSGRGRRRGSDGRRQGQISRISGIDANAVVVILPQALTVAVQGRIPVEELLPGNVVVYIEHRVAVVVAISLIEIET